MGEKLAITKTWLTSKKFTPIQIVVLIVAMIYAVFTETDIFENLQWYWKLVIYIALPVIALFMGVSLVDVKKIISEMRLIWSDKSKTTEEKVYAMLRLLGQVALLTGELFEVYQDEQFSGTKAMTAEEKIAEAKRLLEEANNETG